MLTQYVSVYVPSTRDISHKLSREDKKRYIDKIAREFSREFGGCTSTPGIGYYVTDSGELIREDVTIVKSYYPALHKDSLEFARKIARELKASLSQESVTIETRQGIEFV
jgi:hypothetical protein